MNDCLVLLDMTDEKVKTKSISITVPEDVLEEIKKIARQERRSVSSLVTVLMEEKIREVSK
jgi:hypothetical protein